MYKTLVAPVTCLGAEGAALASWADMKSIELNKVSLVGSIAGVEMRSYTNS